MRLGVSPTATSTPTGVFNQRFEALFPQAGALGCAVCFTPLPFPLPPIIYAGMWGRRVCQPPPCCESSPGCLSRSLLLVWMNVSSLSPWLSDFHTVRFSVSSGCFLFLNCCARRHSVSTYASILARSPDNRNFKNSFRESVISICF